MTTESLPAILIARNPATGAELARVPATPPEAVAEIVARARRAQPGWAARPWSDRKAALKRWKAILARDADAWADILRDEIGKPRGEALAGEVVPTLDALRWTIRNAGRVLKSERLGAGWQRWLLMPSARLDWQPLGVVGMIGTWNYPLFLNVPPIGQALAAGNAVVWKPSELATLAGLKTREGLEEAGFPPDLVGTVFGGAEAGRALVAADIAKGTFTGGVANGRRVLADLANRGIPALAELSGYDPAVILPDAPLESTTRAIAWAGFVGCGQTCVSLKRVLVVGDPAPWAEALAAIARSLRVGNAATTVVDVGPMISESARDRFHHMIEAVVAAGAHVLAGGALLPGPGWFYAPTVLLGDGPEADAALAGAFGPVLLVRGFPDLDTAVAAANASEYGLAASVWGRDLRAARAAARRLEAGSVAVNEAVTPTAHAAAPFGGMKASGFGRTKGALGLREFAQPRVLHVRAAGGFRPQLFPYGDLVERAMRVYCRVYHPRA